MYINFNLRRQATPTCPAGTQHFSCGLLGVVGAFDGCCSVNPCQLLDSKCPDDEKGDNNEPQPTPTGNVDDDKDQDGQNDDKKDDDKQDNNDNNDDDNKENETSSAPTEPKQTPTPTPPTPPTSSLLPTPTQETKTTLSTAISSHTTTLPSTPTLPTTTPDLSTDIPTTTDPITTGPSGTPNSTPLSAATSPESPSEAPSQTLSTGAIVGISVGSFVFLLLIGLLLWRKHARRVERHASHQTEIYEKSVGGDKFAPDGTVGSGTAYTDIFRARPAYGDRPDSTATSSDGSINGVPVVETDLLNGGQSFGNQYSSFRRGNF